MNTYLQPGNPEGGFAFNKAGSAERIRILQGDAPTLPPIAGPTCVRWAEHDPPFPPRLGRQTRGYLHRPRPVPVPGGGHFPHMEAPEQVAAEIARFFGPKPAG